MKHGDPTDNERCAVFSPDKRILAASDAAGQVVRLWDWRSGTRLREIAVDAKYLNCLAFSPDGRLLASGSFDHRAVVFMRNDVAAQEAHHFRVGEELGGRRHIVRSGRTTIKRRMP